MPSDIELENLRGRILSVARNERHGLLVIPMGVFLASAGLVVGILEGNGLFRIGYVFIILFGVLSSVIGFLVTTHYAHEYNSLLRELDKASSVGKCE